MTGEVPPTPSQEGRPVTYAAAPQRERRPFLILTGIIALLSSGLIVYSQFRAFAWDEGFHLIAAHLISIGKRPYIDFCFPQTPLNAYWNAIWLRLFGESWRAPHIAASILTTLGILMAADYILTRFPERRWRFIGALTVVILVGLNGAVVEFGTISQAYGMCVFLTIAAFRVAIIAVDRPGPLWTAVAGLLMSAAVGSTLLVAPALPVLFLWMIFYNRAGKRLVKIAAFLAGAIVPMIPVLVLFIKAPYLVYFNLFGYHLFYRRVHWEGATGHDVDVLTSWANSGSVLTTIILALAGLYFVAKRSGWERPIRAEFYLSALLAIFITAEIATAHPTFAWYFLMAIPFLAIPAVAGLYSVSIQMFNPYRPAWPVFVVLVVLSVALERSLLDDTDAVTWKNIQAIAAKVNQVTPPNGAIFADEHIYLLAHREPPYGMEFAASHKLEMPMSQALPLHILPGPELIRRIKAGYYDTIATCEDEDEDKKRGIPDVYTQKADVGDCHVFWGKKK